MNSVIKIIIITAVVISFVTTVSLLLPSELLQPMHDAIVYFLSFIGYLQSFIDISVLFICMRFLVDFYFGLITMFYIYYMLKIIAG